VLFDARLILEQSVTGDITFSLLLVLTVAVLGWATASIPGS